MAGTLDGATDSIEIRIHLAGENMKKPITVSILFLFIFLMISRFSSAAQSSSETPDEYAQRMVRESAANTEAMQPLPDADEKDNSGPMDENTKDDDL